MSYLARKWAAEEYESVQTQERRAFFEQVQEEREVILEALRTTVSTWTENEIEAGNVPTLECFCDEYKEWDHHQLYDTIEAEIGRVARLCQN